MLVPYAREVLQQMPVLFASSIKLDLPNPFLAKMFLVILEAERVARVLMSDFLLLVTQPGTRVTGGGKSLLHYNKLVTYDKLEDLQRSLDETSVKISEWKKYQN